MRKDPGFKVLKAQAGVITPKEAHNYLQLNTYEAQRNMKDRHLNELIISIKNGEWRSAEISIAVLPDGTHILVNGQHTLEACMMAERDIFVFVTKYTVGGNGGLANLYMTFDMGRGARSIQDAVRAELHALKLDWPLQVAGLIATAAANIETKSFRPNLGKAARAKLIGQYIKEGAFVISICQGPAKNHRHLRRGPVITAMVQTFQANPKSAEWFWRLTRDDTEPIDGYPPDVLRDYLLVRPETWDRRGLYSKCINAFNAFVRDKKIRELTHNPDAPVPEPLKHGRKKG